jgi:DNA-binding beta-propeller fold protein YncE
MDLKRKVKVGDSVMYEDGEVAVDEDGNLLIVVSIDRDRVYYTYGEFDYLDNVYPVPLLLKELF